MRSGRRFHAMTRSSGSSLIETLVAIAVLSFGLLGLVRMQTGAVAQASESRTRLLASGLSEELLAQVHADLANADCYTVPATGACANATGGLQTQAWYERVKTTLTGYVAASSALSGTRLTVTLSWTGKGSQDVHTLVSTTDVTP